MASSFKRNKYERLIELPRTSFFLLGLRGVGKSTLVEARLPGARVVSLLQESLYQSYLVRPDAFVEDLSTLKEGSWVVVDEVQRLPSLLNAVHQLIERRHLRFALLGSSARKLRRGGVNLLGGRALPKYLHPLLPAELGTDFVLDRILQWGSIPLIWNSEDPAAQLEAYLQLYIKEEIQAEAIVRNLPGFARFLPIAALFHGQVINVEALGRDSGVARSTVEGYLKILEDTLIAFQVPAFERRLRVRQRAHPKLYWADSGLVRATKRQFGSVSQEERGPLFEGFIAQVLKAHHELKRLECEQISYWSAGKGSLEVDFVLERGADSVGIEVKASANVSPDWFKGLTALHDERVISRALVVYLGARRFQHASGVEVWPVGEFLSALTEL